MAVEHVDVLIVGAGISGIGAACHLTRESPGTSYLILERRERLGGTWDLFRYPGIRSDSDMFTFGYNFRPWNDIKVLADGPSIQKYVRETAAEYDVESHIRYGIRVLNSSWSSETETWTVTTRDEASGETRQFRAGFLLACTGYYDYDEPYRPEFPGEEDFTGQVVHPQHWPQDLDYRGKRVVIIGSGATAVTLVPAMAPDAAHVTMLQRSPTYIVSLPAQDAISAGLRRILPESVVYQLARRRNIGLQRAMYALSRSQPGVARSLILKAAARQLRGTSDIKHFTPRYNPWDQRLCVVPDGDLFRAIRKGQADIVTDRIERFTPTGIRLESGAELEADIIITATGLRVQMLGGSTVDVDGEPVVLRDHLTYKGVMLDGVPNAIMVFGYTNASWTLKADLACEYACRLINHMREHGYTRAEVHADPTEFDTGSVLGSLASGYVQRGDAQMPRQGRRGPWRVRNDYLRDAPMLRRGSIEDGVLQLSRGPRTATRPTQQQVTA